VPRMMLGLWLGAGAASGGTLQFNRDIRPILAENCFACHGPDSAARKAGLRLDHRNLALQGGKSGQPAIVPGRSGQSELIHRILSRDPEEVMPRPKSGKHLTPQQVDTLKLWVDEGAEYEGHWAFVPPTRVEPPSLKTKTGSGSQLHPVDAFIRARLEREGLPFAPQASAATLARRVSLDLTGLPPTPAEVAAFERAAAGGFDAAYDALVTRLLGSRHYGEHMAVRWLDLARYADTSGFQGDPVRTMWPWRDYVIDSFNRNKPFDRFTMEQIAGDLLPDATLETRLATGFHRNHRFNTEFGAIEEEWKVENVIDRVETFGATWLALTVGCGRCHDHKYDPVSQREFYQLFAFFNNVPERGVYWDVFGADAVAFEPAGKPAQIRGAAGPGARRVGAGGPTLEYIRGDARRPGLASALRWHPGGCVRGAVERGRHPAHDHEPPGGRHVGRGDQPDCAHERAALCRRAEDDGAGESRVRGGAGWPSLEGGARRSDSDLLQRAGSAEGHAGVLGRSGHQQRGVVHEDGPPEAARVGALAVADECVSAFRAGPRAI